MKYLADAEMPPPITTIPSISWAAWAMARPATRPISSKEALAAFWLPGRVPSAMSKMSLGVREGSCTPDCSE